MNTRASYSHHQRGFIALISAVIISAVLLALMTTAGLAGFWARFDALGSEEKAIARGLADSCINVALLALATSSDPARYAPSEQKVVVGVSAHGDLLTCTIKDVVHAGQNVTVEAYASSQGSFSAVSATATLPPGVRIISWSEN